MKGLSAVLFCITLGVTPIACGQDKAQDKGKPPTEAQKKQQARMSACNKQAGDKKGDERKKFMSGCLKGGGNAGPSAAQKAQQDKMGDCNRQANLKNMKGEQRKTFMSSCLKG